MRSQRARHYLTQRRRLLTDIKKDVKKTEERENAWGPLLAVLAGVDTGEYDMEASLGELRELAASAGYETAGVITQRRPEPDAATCLGAGRVEELAQFARNAEADAVIFDHELSPVQLRNLEEACGLPVIDRTMLILDIFAQRAVSAEGKLQVELARLRYQLPRLGGMGVQLSRQGGGGGGGGGARRGAGETKLETDRRHIQRRISALSARLRELGDRRQRLRERRKKDGVTTVAIVGYTNVGKSTLLNTLTDAGVLAEDKLFATLDPTARALKLPDGRSVMLVDTVGLIRRLPHHLVEAFHSTLEEAVEADLILNVCDISSEETLAQIETTRQVLQELGAGDKPVVTVLNKCDKLSQMPLVLEKGCVFISAKTGFGLEKLLEAIEKALPPTHLRLKLMIPFDKAAIYSRLKDSSVVYAEEYTAHGILVDALVDMMEQGPVTIQMSDYSGFEKVGPLGTSLPTSNQQTTTQAGDIVLYQGNQIVIFYGSNSWSYTRLGHIDDLSGWEEALGTGDVTVTFSLGG